MISNQEFNEVGLQRWRGRNLPWFILCFSCVSHQVMHMITRLSDLHSIACIDTCNDIVVIWNVVACMRVYRWRNCRWHVVNCRCSVGTRHRPKGKLPVLQMSHMVFDATNYRYEIKGWLSLKMVVRSSIIRWLAIVLMKSSRHFDQGLFRGILIDIWVRLI